MKIRDLLLAKGTKAKGKDITIRAKIRSKKNNPKKKPGKVSFRSPPEPGLSGNFLNGEWK